MAKDLYIHDAASGLDLHASAYIPLPLFMSIKDSEASYMLEQMVGWEADFIDQETEDTIYRRLGTTEGFEVSQEWLGYMQRVKSGQAKILSRRATNFPKIGEGMRPFVSATLPLGVAYDINLFQDAAARKFGISVDRQGLEACAEYIDQGLDEIWHYGGISEEDHLSVNGMFQMFNGGADAQLEAGTSLPKVTLAAGDAGSTWTLKTGNEIDDDIAAGIAEVKLRSRGKKKVKKVLWGIKVGALLAKKTIVDDDGNVVRMPAYLKTAYPEIEFIEDNFLDDMQITNEHETFAGESSVFFYDDAKTNFKFRANDREIIHPYETSKGFQLVTVNTFGLTGGIQMFNNYFGAYLKGVIAA